MLGIPLVFIPTIFPRAIQAMRQQNSILIESPGETAHQVMMFVHELFFTRVLDYTQIEVLEATKTKVGANQANLILTKEEHVEQLVGQKWGGRALSARSEQAPGGNYILNELQFTNIPRVAENEVNRIEDLCTQLADAFERDEDVGGKLTVGRDGNRIDTIFLHPTNGGRPSLKARMESEDLYRAHFTSRPPVRQPERHQEGHLHPHELRGRGVQSMGRRLH